MKPIYWAVLLAPILGPVIWWLLFTPGRMLHNWLWQVLPEGRLRRILLKERDGKWVTVKPPRGPLS